MFIAALFTVAKIWNLNDEWIKKMWYVYIYIPHVCEVEKQQWAGVPLLFNSFF